MPRDSRGGSRRRASVSSERERPCGRSPGERATASSARRCGERGASSSPLRRTLGARPRSDRDRPSRGGRAAAARLHLSPVRARQDARARDARRGSDPAASLSCRRCARRARAGPAQRAGGHSAVLEHRGHDARRHAAPRGTAAPVAAPEPSGSARAHGGGLSGARRARAGHPGARGRIRQTWATLPFP